MCGAGRVGCNQQCRMIKLTLSACTFFRLGFDDVGYFQFYYLSDKVDLSATAEVYRINVAMVFHKYLIVKNEANESYRGFNELQILTFLSKFSKVII